MQLRGLVFKTRHELEFREWEDNYEDADECGFV
jgi:hypothetical protein